MLYVRNATSPRTGRPVANQFIIETNNHSYLQSYNSLVAVVYWDNEAKRYYAALGPDWDYSVTTMKYVYQFLNEAYDSETKWNKTKVWEAVENGDIKYCPYAESDLEKF